MKAIIITIIIVLLILVGVYFFTRTPSEQTLDQTENEIIQDPNQGITVGDINSINVTNQNPDSISILIDYASLQAPGFIVIHQVNTQGEPGTIIASSNILSPGEHRSVPIIVTTTPDTSYIAMLHADDGNNNFDPQFDPPLTDNNGNVVMITFRVNPSQLQPSQSAPEQTPVPTKG
jgi:hypothetical protein